MKFSIENSGSTWIRVHCIMDLTGWRSHGMGSESSAIRPTGRTSPPRIRKGPEAAIAVFLVPARTDTIWFHELVLPLAREIRFLKGRLRFGDGQGRATFPSMVIVFDQKLRPRGNSRAAQNDTISQTISHGKQPPPAQPHLKSWKAESKPIQEPGYSRIQRTVSQGS